MTITGKTITFPEGFNKKNTVIVGFGTIRQSDYEAKGLNYGDTSGTGLLSNGAINGAVPKSAGVYSDGIHISIANFNTSSVNYMYKLVLMKV